METQYTIEHGEFVLTDKAGTMSPEDLQGLKARMGLPELTRVTRSELKHFEGTHEKKVRDAVGYRALDIVSESEGIDWGETIDVTVVGGELREFVSN